MAFSSGSGSGGDDYGAIAEMNVIPLVDVMLVLLIITMVTTPFLEQGVQVELPVAQGQSLQKEATSEPVILYVSRDRNLRVGDKSVPRSQLSDHLRRVFQDRTDREIFVRADKEVPYGFVAEIISQARLSGIERVGLVTASE